MTVQVFDPENAYVDYKQPECEICRVLMPPAFYESSDGDLDFYAHDECYRKRQEERARKAKR